MFCEWIAIDVIYMCAHTCVSCIWVVVCGGVLVRLRFGAPEIADGVRMTRVQKHDTHTSQK